MTTNYLSSVYCLQSYKGRVNQMDYLLNSPTPMQSILLAKTLLDKKENFLEFYEEIPTSTVNQSTHHSTTNRMFYFNSSSNLYQRLAGTAYERGKYKVSKTRVAKYRSLLTFFTSEVPISNQDEFNSRLVRAGSSPFKSFEDTHYWSSTMHEVEVKNYESFEDIPYRDKQYGPCRKYATQLCTETKYFLTLACSCKEYSSNGFRCPEILAVLSILNLYDLDAELGTLEPIQKKGRPKKRGKALSKDVEYVPRSYPMGLVNEPVRCSTFGTGVIRSYRVQPNGDNQW